LAARGSEKGDGTHYGTQWGEKGKTHPPKRKGVSQRRDLLLKIESQKGDAKGISKRKTPAERGRGDGKSGPEVTSKGTIDSGVVKLIWGAIHWA